MGDADPPQTACASIICAPAQKEHKLISQDVVVSDAERQASDVAAFIDGLVPADGEPDADPPPSVHHLYLPHPEDAWQHAVQMTQLLGRNFDDIPTGPDLDTLVQLARQDLQRRYQAASSTDRDAGLHCLRPRNAVHPIRRQHARSLHHHSYTYRPPAHPSGDDLRRKASVAPVVVQFALHDPHANFAVQQILLATADQTLADLRDAIYCVSDLYAARIAPAVPSAALFYINNVLYPSTAPPGEPDCAAGIQAFLRERSSAAGDALNRFLAQQNLRAATPRPAVPEARPMDATRLRDLRLSVNDSSYLFSHLGACEHMLTVQDVRLKHADDPEEVLDAPVTLFLQRGRKQRCGICAARPAQRMAYDDPLAPSSPAFFCGECFDDLHLDGDGQLLPEAAAAAVYDYIHE